MPQERPIKIELVSHQSAVIYRKRWQPLQAFEKPFSFDATVGLDITDHHVGSARAKAAGRLEHGVGFTDAGGCAEEDTQPSTFGARLVGLNVSKELIRIGTDFVHAPNSPESEGSFGVIQSEIQLEHIDAGLTDHPQKLALGMGCNECSHRFRGNAPDSCDSDCLVV